MGRAFGLVSLVCSLALVAILMALNMQHNGPTSSTAKRAETEAMRASATDVEALRAENEALKKQNAAPSPNADGEARELARLAASPLSEAASGAGERVLDDAALVAERLLDAVTSGPLRSRSFLARNRIDSTGTVR